MPNLKRNLPDEFTSNNELEATARVLETVHRQIEDYKVALRKVLELRAKVLSDEELSQKLRASPEVLFEFLKSNGIVEHLSAAMAAEEFKTMDFPGGGLGLWTWSCCCTKCCFTCWSQTCKETNKFTGGGLGPSYEAQ
ncbi:hypothetical protein [Bradyrhizobium sp. B117]|uniref:hypothetical protein n=1 Tax=Bradyrhizobium sp. B117 TaxID=3140246 RepID=UPI0031838E26